MCSTQRGFSDADHWILYVVLALVACLAVFGIAHGPMAALTIVLLLLGTGLLGVLAHYGAHELCERIVNAHRRRLLWIPCGTGYSPTSHTAAGSSYTIDSAWSLDEWLGRVVIGYLPIAAAVLGMLGYDRYLASQSVATKLLVVPLMVGAAIAALVLVLELLLLIVALLGIVLSWVATRGWRLSRNLGAADGEGRTLLHRAAAQDDPKLVAMVLARGVNCAPRDAGGATPLHEARSLDAVRLLLRAGADPNALDASGNTPLHRCAAFLSSPVEDLTWSLPMLQALIDGGADRSLQNADGRTPAELVDAKGQPRLAQLLRGGGQASDRDGGVPPQAQSHD